MKSGNNARKAPLSSDSLIAFTLEQMNARLAAQSGDDEKKQLRSGLLYLGNVHDAIPRQLILDTRLSPLDKMAWIMIRLYAQQNAGQSFLPMMNCNCNWLLRTVVRRHGKPSAEYY